MKLQVTLQCFAFVLLCSMVAAHIQRIVGHLFSPKSIYSPDKLNSFLKLSANNTLEIRKSMKTVQGTVTKRLQQMYAGLEVVGASVAVDYSESLGYTGTVRGEVVTELEEDIPDPHACLRSKHTVKQVAFKAAGVKRADVSNIRVKRGIYIKPDGKAVLTYEVNFFSMKNNVASRPCYFIDACSLNVVHSFDNIDNKEFAKGAKATSCGTTPPPPSSEEAPCPGSSAGGIGGNVKTGKWFYGKGDYCLNTTLFYNFCVLQNDYVKVVNAFYSYLRVSLVPAFYNCKMYNDAINGAYSPVLDALYFGTASAKMFLEWYDMQALSFQPLLYVHYGIRYENAFWDGRSLTFGDGYNIFHPLVCLDVVAHELAHGVTTQSSDLVYENQPGGINEAFSDITGEATEMFARGSNDWLTGAEIFKACGKALRYFSDPTLDGISIKHIDDYCTGMNVHYSSGIFNHAFYQLVHVNSMPMKDAYECFLRANLLYWGRTTTFEDGACDVLQACCDLGFDTSKVRSSFQVTGLLQTGCTVRPEPVSGPQVVNNIIVSSHKNPLFQLIPEANSTSVKVNILETGANISMILSPSVEDRENGQSLSSGDKYTFSPGSESVYLTLASSFDEEITGVSMEVVFE